MPQRPAASAEPQPVMEPLGTVSPERYLPTATATLRDPHAAARRARLRWRHRSAPLRRAVPTPDKATGDPAWPRTTEAPVDVPARVLPGVADRQRPDQRDRWAMQSRLAGRSRTTRQLRESR